MPDNRKLTFMKLLKVSKLSPFLVNVYNKKKEALDNKFNFEKSVSFEIYITVKVFYF